VVGVDGQLGRDVQRRVD